MHPDADAKEVSKEAKVIGAAKGKPPAYVRPGYRGANAGYMKILEQVTLLSQQKHNLKLIFPGRYSGRGTAESRTSNVDRVVSSCRNELRDGHVT